MYPLLPEEIYLRSKHEACKILNHNVYEYIITTQISLRYFSIIAPPGCCCIIEFTYRLIKYTYVPSYTVLVLKCFWVEYFHSITFNFQLLTRISHINIHICLKEKAFPVTNTMDFVFKSPTAWVVGIDMIPIKNTLVHAV